MTLPELPSNLTGAGIQAYLVWKLLGPPAGAVGATLSNLVDYTAENVGRVFKNAASKVGAEALEEEGSVPPRALGKILDEAAYADEAIVVEYLGGVLASSRTPQGRDDRGLAWTSLIGRLTRDQLRLHYLLYDSAREALQGQDLNLGMSAQRDNHELFYSWNDLLELMDFTQDDLPNWHQHFTEAFHGLDREDLVGTQFSYGSVEDLSSQFPAVTESGLIWRMSVAGIRLYMWGHGQGTEPLDAFLTPGLDWSLEEPIGRATRSGSVAGLTLAREPQDTPPPASP